MKGSRRPAVSILCELVTATVVVSGVACTFAPAAAGWPGFAAALGGAIEIRVGGEVFTFVFTGAACAVIFAGAPAVFAGVPVGFIGRIAAFAGVAGTFAGAPGPLATAPAAGVLLGAVACGFWACIVVVFCAGVTAGLVAGALFAMPADGLAVVVGLPVAAAGFAGAAGDFTGFGLCPLLVLGAVFFRVFCGAGAFVLFEEGAWAGAVLSAGAEAGVV